jgi:hypothetical protein
MRYQSNNKFVESQMWARLSRSKKDILKRILGQTSFKAALANLNKLPALREGLKIGIWHKILGAKIDEVSITKYLEAWR